MPQAATASTTTAPYAQALADLRQAAEIQKELARSGFPLVYAVTPEGACMEPVLKHGEPIIVSSTAPCEPGDLVVIHIRHEFVKPGQFGSYVKRLKYPLYGMQFPWDAAGSDVTIPVTVEQLNPPKTLNIYCDRILAVHKVLGVGARSRGKVVAPAAMLEAA